MHVHRSLAAITLAASLFATEVCSAEDHGAAIASAARLQVAAQRLAHDIQAAAGGDVLAFSNLEQMNPQLEVEVEQLRSVDQRGEISKAWTALNGGARNIVEKRQRILDAHAANRDLQENAPMLLVELDEAARALIESKAPASQLYLVMRQMVILERMRQSASTILRGGPEAAMTGDRLARDASMFGSVLEGLLKGNRERGIEAVTDTRLRGILENVDRRWRALEPVQEKLVESMGDLGDASEAGPMARADSEKIVHEVDKLIIRLLD